MKEIKVAPIKNGTVIDHISCGMALKVLKVLELSDGDVDAPHQIHEEARSAATPVGDVASTHDIAFVALQPIVQRRVIAVEAVRLATRSARRRVLEIIVEPF